MNARYSDLLKNIEPSKFFNIMHEIESISLAKFDVPFMYVDYLYRGKNEILLVKYFCPQKKNGNCHGWLMRGLTVRFLCIFQKSLILSHRPTFCIVPRN